MNTSTVPCTIQMVVLAATLALLGASRAHAQQADSASPTPPHSERLYLHAFRSPSIGAEYRNRNFGVHAGLYTTILGSGSNSTEFFKTGVTGYFGGRADSKFEGFASMAYVRGLNRDYRNQDGIFGEVGVRVRLVPRVDLRVGVGVLGAEGHKAKVNPTIGIGYAIPLR